MKPLTDVIIVGAKPIKGMKSLGSLSNLQIDKSESILDNQVRNLHKKININNIYYINNDINIITNNKVKILQNTHCKTKNNGHSLYVGMKKVTSNNVLILFHRFLFSHKIFNFFDYNVSQIFMSNYSEYKIGSIVDNNKVISLFYNLPNRCCGMYYLANRETQYLRSFLQQNDCDQMFIFEIMNKIIDLGAKFQPKLINNKKYIYEIANNSSLEKLKKYYAKNFVV